MDQEPKLKSKKEQLIRPKSLREFYDLVVKLCPSPNHDENEFIKFLDDVLKRDGIRTRSLQREIEEKKFELEFPPHWPLNDFRTAAQKYLIGVGFSDEDAQKFWMKVRDL
jgi:hypothetical protein